MSPSMWPLRARIIILQLTSISLAGLLVGCATDSYTSKGAAEGATTGAVAGAMGGLMSALVFGGDPR